MHAEHPLAILSEGRWAHLAAEFDAPGSSWCEENRVEYVFGLARNQRLEPMIASELAEAKANFLATSKPARIQGARLPYPG